MTYIYYCFEAKSIQRFILRGGKLRDMVGASEMVERLFTLEFGRVLAALRMDRPPMPRCGGGALTLPCKSRKEAEAFRDLWSFQVQQVAPGMPFVHAIVTVTDRKELPEKQALALRAQRGRPLPRLPLAAPFAEREPRTAKVATTRWRPPGESVPIPIDEETRAKRALVEELNRQLSGRTKGKKEPFEVIRKLGFELKDYVWPLHGRPKPEEFEGEATLLRPGEEGYLAIVHADGNRLGQLLHAVRNHANRTNEYDVTMQCFSAMVSEATNRAAKEAVRRSIGKDVRKDQFDRIVVPVRPLILGGDDLTFIMRADVAIAFTQCFLEQFQKMTQSCFGNSRLMAQIPLLTKGMTACAGIAFMKPNMPFGLVYRLAHELCDKAKSVAKALAKDPDVQAPLSMAFHRVTNATIDNLSLLRQRELNDWSSRVADSGLAKLPIQVSLQPFAIEGRALGMPLLADVLSLGKELKVADQRGPLREILRLSHLNLERTERALIRWLENLNGHKHSETLLASLKELFGRLTTTYSAAVEESEMPNVERDWQASERETLRRIRDKIPILDLHGRTPLGDIITLMEVDGLGEIYE